MKKLLKISAIFVVLFFGLYLFIFSNHIGGWQTFIVKSGSMEPHIPTGAVVIDRNVHPTYLKTGDVITFISPTKERDFVTHRITKITDDQGYISFKTKGDNNKTEDVWNIAGGSVVGKVTYTIPYIGYLMSFAQSKIGILLFILIPSIYIVVEETNSVINLFRKKEPKLLETSKTAPILLLTGIFFSLSQSSLALLSDSASITNNSFAVVIPTSPTPTFTPTPTPCPDDTTIIIRGNGAGSNNSVSVSNSSSITVKQTKTQL